MHEGPIPHLSKDKVVVNCAMIRVCMGSARNAILGSTPRTRLPVAVQWGRIMPATWKDSEGRARAQRRRRILPDSSGSSATKAPHTASAMAAEEESSGPTPCKAYRNPRFIDSRAARGIRVQCELEEPQHRLSQQAVENVIMVFGSARARAAPLGATPRPEVSAKSSPEDAAAQLSSAYASVEALGEKLARWSVERAAAGLPAYAVGTGGGPGLMEAANKGALAGGGRSVGFGISLPFETGLNRFVEPELAFTFHYFMTRKMTMAYRMSALVIAPGGFGTCDELFEILTLKQTGKIKRDLPVVLLGGAFWKTVINWPAFVAAGVVAEKDVSSLTFADTSDAAFEAVVRGIVALEEVGHVGAPTLVEGRDAEQA